MRWVRRGFWMMAWGVWAALGVGLYRELPRKLGPTVCRLWKNNECQPIGFVGKSDLVAALAKPEVRGGAQTLEVFDAADGRRVLSTSGPSSLSPLQAKAIPRALAASVYLCNRNAGDQKPDFSVHRGTLHALDLPSGKWTRLSAVTVELLSVHPTLPLVAFFENIDKGYVVVADFRTGERLFEYGLPRRFLLGATPIFLGNDRIVLAQEPLFGKSPDGSWVYDVFKIDVPTAPLKSMQGPPIDRSARPSTNGRVAFLTPDSTELGVFDLEREAVVFSTARTPPSNTAMRPATTVISPSGRSVLDVGERKLFDVETGALLWRTEPPHLVAAPANVDDFVVMENWSALWSRVAPKFVFETAAWRQFDCGELIWRTNKNDWVSPQQCNADRTLVIMNDGAVRRMPLRVNWMLLAVCQAVLALPLVLLWTIVRWRRRRAGRRQIVESAA